MCNRSFNQRSNLKTHLLTHTDHKPYECGTCGKVFRRNCDLRRHALTHTIGGDSAPDSNENGDRTENRTTTDDDDHDDEELIEHEDDDNDTVLEVDSPVHSPIAVVSEHGDDLDHETTDLERGERTPIDRVDRQRTIHRRVGGGGGDDDDCDEPPRKILHLDGKTDERVAITHCHDGQEHYTMRPQRAFYLQMSQTTEQSTTNANVNASKLTEPYAATLHVRRDLHYSGGAANGPPSSFLGAVPFRKRPLGYSREAIDESAAYDASHTLPLHGSPLNLSNHPMTAVMSSPLPQRSPIATVSSTSPQQPAQPSNPRRTGFSIEDIMRR